ncbi:MAG: hypothetical protein EOP62_12540 [Sphingomonadales bacterium]|nr:MAG: hypothetical protein EOP62_12540 [Sphingomonadales bacterium]
MKGTALELERTVVEGHPSDGKTRRALDRLIRSHAGCYPRFRPPLQNQTEFFGRCNLVVADPQFKIVMCRAPYDRMAIVEQAFLSYAPHFMLSRADTLDKAVIGRFDARETARGKYRTPLDRRYYDAVACMVQLEPESAVRLIRTPFGSGNEATLRAAIIAKTSRCTQNAKKVSVDPPQFRGYVADALYHWTIAAKGIETLVPAN